jgi:hypothetical protein
MVGMSKAAMRIAEMNAGRTAGMEKLQGFGEVTLADVRRQALSAFREARTQPAGFAAVADVANWVPIGPSAVRHGQAIGTPVVSGRVPDLAVSENGERVYVASANGGVWRSLDSGRSWEPLSDQRDWHTENASVDSLATGAIALVESDDHTASSDRLYVGTGEATASQDWLPTGYLGVGMLRSDDGGRTWNQEADDQGDILGGEGTYGIAVDPNNRDLAMAATTVGVFMRDAGVWKQQTLGTNTTARATSVAVSRVGGVTRFFASYQQGQVFMWTQAGGWTALPSVPSLTAGFNVARVTLACSASNPPVLYAISSRHRPPGVTDPLNDTFNAAHRLLPLNPVATRNWVRLNGVPAGLTGNQGWYDLAVVVDPANENRIYVGGSAVQVPPIDTGEWVAAIYRCDVTPPVGAATVTACTQALIGHQAHSDVHALRFTKGSSQELWVGCDGGVFRTPDSTATNVTFESLNVGLATMTLTGLVAHPNEESWAFCGAQDNGGLRYDGSEVWDHQLWGDGGATVFERSGQNRIISIYFEDRLRRAAIGGGRYIADGTFNSPAAGHKATFYPPMAQAPDDPKVLVFGADRPFITKNFGDSWTALTPLAGVPMDNPTTGAQGARLRSLVMVSKTRFYAGWSSGHIARYDLSGHTWSSINISRRDATPAHVLLEIRPITGIAVDPADNSGQSAYVCAGGVGSDHVWHVNSSAAAPVWVSRSGTPAKPLLEIHHNAIVVDKDASNLRLYAAADLGVWTSGDGGATWDAVAGNLPDAAVIDLDIVRINNAGPLGEHVRVLRASTHGRGVFELSLEDEVPPRVELMLRANPLDQRRRNARAGAAYPTRAVGAPTSTLDESPDIFVDAPDNQGFFTLPGDRVPNLVELVERLGTANQVVASVPGTSVDTRVYVVVRNRGVLPTDGVRVTLLIGPVGETLPDEYRVAARGGTLPASSKWKLAGTTTVNGVVAGRPSVALLTLSSASLPPKDQAIPQPWQLLALLDHTSDAFPANASTDVATLVARERRSALKRVAAVDATGRGSSRGGTGLLIPMGTTIAAHDRLTEIRDRLRAKVAAGGPHLRPVERRLLAMAEAGLASLELGAKAPVPAGSPGAGIGKYALLGALGFEIPAYSTAFVAGGPWVAETLHRGTGDPHLSRVAVAASELPLNLAKLGRNEATGADQETIRAMASGMLSAAAAGVVLSPQVADMHARDTSADWSPFRGTRGAGALEHYLRQEYLPGATPTTLGGWLPALADVPAVVWEKYLKAIGDTYGLPTNPKPGFGSFEADFDKSLYPGPAHLKSGYGLLLGDLQSSAWTAAGWWAALLPVVLAPVGALAIAREMPNAGKFFDGRELTERSWFELLNVGLGIGSVMPSIYSMLLWSQVDFHTGAFTNALVLGLVRAGLLTTTLASSGIEDLEAWARWGLMYAPMQGMDVYAFIRALITDRQHPGAQKVYAIQTVPTLSTLVTLGLAGIGRAVTDGGDNDTRNFWALAGVSSALLMVGAIPIAFALQGTGGWQAWFRPDPPDLPLLSSVANAGIPPSRPQARARLYEASKLWADPAVASPRADELAYPPGTRPLVRMWWDGSGDLTARITRRSVVFRHGADETTVDVPASSTATSLAALLQSRMPGLKAETVGADTPARPLPQPDALADAGDLVPIEQAEARRTAFAPVGTSRDRATVLRETPRVVSSTTFGRTAPAGAPYPVLPTSPSSTGAAADSGLRDAAELAALMIIAASPTLTPVTAPGAAPPAVAEVQQVFRRWNLDERRLDEWRSLMTGHGATAVPADTLVGTQNPMIRTQLAGYHAQEEAGRVLAEAMGWLPLWRTWLGVATTVGQDVASNAAAPASRPTVSFPDGTSKKPTNLELTNGVRYLLDMGAT